MKRLLRCIKDIFNGLKRENRKTNSSEIANSLRYLGPQVITDVQELKKITPYLELIQGCVEDENIKNIAVTGTYGSGKSTVLKTFQNWYEPFRSKKDSTYLNISLASFDVENSNKEAEDELDFEKKVEFSILQQMIYQVKPGVLPGSRFKRLVNIKKGHLALYVILPIICLISFLILMNYELLRIGPIKILIDSPNSSWNLIPLGLLLIGMGLIIRKAIFLLNNSRIHKVNIKGEMELGDMGESIFNQYLEEILYFFERTSYKVVIIEDIDRFGNTQLFTKLREVNILLNSSRDIKKPIKFIYAVKDELFRDRTERTKFFDFIVPIIPFVNPHNASEQLLKLIKENNIELSEDFINDITSFIGDVDMRLILNVVNEFNLYRKKISAINLDRLMAMVFYKNLYPKDFASLHQDQGELFKLISKKEEYRKALENKLEKQKIKIDKRIEEINSEGVYSVLELRKIYLFHLLSEIPDLIEFDMGFSDVKNAILDENFKKIRTDKKIRYKKHSNGQYRLVLRDGNTNNPFEAIEKQISVNTYIEREKNIKSKSNNEIEKLKQDKFRFSNDQSRISLLSFSELYKKIGKSEDFEDFVEDLKNPGEIRLIEYLITQGYIGDDYRDYISLFFDVSINREDYDFIQKIKSSRSSPFEFQPSDTKKVMDKIPERYFSQRQTLNFDLLSYCLKNKQTEKQKLKLYIETLSSNKDENLEFIFGFAKHKAKEIKPLVQELCKVKTNLWQQLQDANLPEEELRKWVAHIFDFTEEVGDVLKFEEVEKLAKYLSTQNIFDLSKSIPDDRNIKEFLLKKNVKIIELDQPIENQDELFQIIYKNNLFALTPHNIKRLVKYLKPEINIEDLDLFNYSLLRKHGLEPLLEIVNDDIIKYINNVLLSEDNKKETEETILEILNNENIERDIKEKFLLHQKADITNLSNIQDIEGKKSVLKHNKVIPNWLNIFDYYQSAEEKIDKVIIDFINVESNYVELSKSKIKDLYEEKNKTKSFIADLIRSNKIDNEAYPKLLNSLPYSYNFFGLESIDRDKVKILIEKKTLLFTKGNFDEIESSHPDLILFFLENYQDNSEFVNQLLEYEVSDDIIIDILKSDRIHRHHKEGIINSIDETRIISNFSLAQCILGWWPSNVMLEIEYDGLVAIFEVKGNPNKKVGILLKSFESLNKEQIRILIELIGEDYEKLFIPHQKPKFEKSSDNLELISRLKKVHLISSYRVDKSSIKAYPFNKDN